MEKIRIKNFGAIREGFSDCNGYMELSKVTLFLGAQGSGKSTVTKLISTFLWLEKALFRGDFACEDLNYEVFVNKYLAWQSIESYIQDDSEIEFIGTKYCFLLREKSFLVNEINDAVVYHRPKISYVSSERNLCSSIPRADKISGLLHNLALTVEDFQEVSEFIDSVELPIGGFSYRYDKKTKRKYISSKNNWEIQLYEAASGIQSFTPLYLITEYYSNPNLQFSNAEVSGLSSEQKSLVKNAVDSYNLDLQRVSEFSSLVLKAAGIKGVVDSLMVEQNTFFPEEFGSEKFDDFIRGIVNSCFVNIVEEPEQNLYPNSQKALMEFLVKSIQKSGNRLVFTTHSPYVLGTVNNCLYAGNLFHKGHDISEIVERQYHLVSKDVSAYFINDGKIVSAFDCELGQINHDLIDGCSREINKVYEQLSEVEFSQ